MGQFVQDLGAVMHAATIVVGDTLGLYKALAEKPMTVQVLAEKTHTDARYLLEWLSAQAASGYVAYDPATDLFSLTEEQAFALAQEGSPPLFPAPSRSPSRSSRRFPRSWTPFATGAGWAGMNMIRHCFTAPSGFSVRVMRRT